MRIRMRSFAILGLIAASLWLSPKAHATGISLPWGPSGMPMDPQTMMMLNTMPEMLYGQGQLGIYGQSLGQFPGQYPGYQAMDWTSVYVANQLNWNGAQPLGGSYMPPIGLSAIMNGQIHRQMVNSAY